MYSTCIGLILKGFEDYEQRQEDFRKLRETSGANMVANQTESEVIVEKETKKVPKKVGNTSYIQSFTEGVKQFFRDDNIDDFKTK